MKNKEKTLFKVPHTFVILVLLALMALILTYVIPAGAYDRVVDEASGRTLIDAGSFHYIDQTPVSVLGFPVAFYDALIDAASIIAFIFIIGGSFEVITQTGAISVYIGKLVRAFGDKKTLLIPIIMFVFSIGGFSFGMSIEAIVFVQMFIALMISLGYDAIVGTSVVMSGCACGFIAGILNPFNVGVAQAIVGLPMYSGAWLRVILWIVLLAVTSWYVIRYAKKVHADPAKSIVADMDEWGEFEVGGDSMREPGKSDILIGLIMAAGLASIPFGVIRYEWGMGPLAGIFLVMGVAAGLVHGFGPSKIAGIFVTGAKNITEGALIVGVARAISVILTEGNIIDTIVYGLSVPLAKLPHSIQAVGMFIAHTIINLPINSGSGQAAATMPIMGPLAEVVGMSKQTAVLTFQLGDGVTNNIMPTSSALMGMLSLARIPYEKWVRYVAPLIGLWALVAVIFCVAATAIGY